MAWSCKFTIFSLCALIYELFSPYHCQEIFDVNIIFLKNVYKTVCLQLISVHISILVIMTNKHNSYILIIHTLNLIILPTDFIFFIYVYLSDKKFTVETKPTQLEQFSKSH